jgi:hypothetical protein
MNLRIETNLSPLTANNQDLKVRKGNAHHARLIDVDKVQVRSLGTAQTNRSAQSPSVNDVKAAEFLSAHVATLLQSDPVSALLAHGGLDPSNVATLIQSDPPPHHAIDPSNTGTIVQSDPPGPSGALGAAGVGVIVSSDPGPAAT